MYRHPPDLHSFPSPRSSHLGVLDEALIVGFTNKTSLTLAFEDNNVPVKFFKNRDLAVSYLNSVVKDNDVVLFENDLPDHHP